MFAVNHFWRGGALRRMIDEALRTMIDETLPGLHEMFAMAVEQSRF